VAGEVVTPFMVGEVDLVQLVSWRFHSAGIQTVATRQILPLVPPEPGRADGRDAVTSGGPSVVASAQPRAGQESGGQESVGRDGGAVPSEVSGGFYEFEPQPEELLQLLVPRYAEAILYSALLEASASEHTARQRAMAAATENAEEFITTLRRVMNRVRQDAVTTEIIEIAGGAEALRSAGPTGYVDIDMESSEERIA
jgi:F-type H+-transporting ATPase subunit gamma